MNRPSLGVMVLCHKRHQLLPLIHEQIKTTWPDAVVDMTLDRASHDVVEAVYKIQQAGHNVRAFPSPFAAIDGRENFIALRDWQLQKLHETGCKYIAMWDDDHILADPLEAKKAMDDGVDLIYATKAYFWDGLDSINIGLPRHTSILFSRRVEGDRWTKMVGAPQRASELLNSRELVGPLLDVGYMAESERERVWKVYKRAGKIDLLTTGLVQDPTLHRVREALAENVWYQKLECALLAESAGALKLPTRG